MAETELTRPARALVCQARRLSARLGHGYVGSEHLLLALKDAGGRHGAAYSDRGGADRSGGGVRPCPAGRAGQP